MRVGVVGVNPYGWDAISEVPDIDGTYLETSSGITEVSCGVSDHHHGNLAMDEEAVESSSSAGLKYGLFSMACMLAYMLAYMLIFDGAVRFSIGDRELLSKVPSTRPFVAKRVIFPQLCVAGHDFLMHECELEDNNSPFNDPSTLSFVDKRAMIQMPRAAG